MRHFCPRISVFPVMCKKKNLRKKDGSWISDRCVIETDVKIIFYTKTLCFVKEYTGLGMFLLHLRRPFE